jgi:hypothetical protein
MSELARRKTEQNWKTEFRRNQPITGPKLAQKLSRQSQPSFPLDDRTALHRLSFMTGRGKRRNRTNEALDGRQAEFINIDSQTSSSSRKP